VHHSLIFTLIGSSDSLDLHIQIYGCYILLTRYLGRSSCIARSSDLFIWSSHLGYRSYFVLHSLFHLFDPLYRLNSTLFYLIIHKIILSCVEIICIIAVTLLPLLLIYITCLGHFRLSVYTWDIFLAYIRRWLSSCLRSSVFWEAGRDILPCSQEELMVQEDSIELKKNKEKKQIKTS